MSGIPLDSVVGQTVGKTLGSFPAVVCPSCMSVVGLAEVNLDCRPYLDVWGSDCNPTMTKKFVCCSGLTSFSTIFQSYHDYMYV